MIPSALLGKMPVQEQECGAAGLGKPASIFCMWLVVLSLSMLCCAYSDAWCRKD